MAKSHRDLTMGPVWRLTALLALPSTLENVMFAASSIINTYWMGRVPGMAIAAVTLGTTLRLALISPMMGLSAGGMAVVARHLGAKEQAQADKAVMQTLLLVVLFVVPLGLIGLAFGGVFLRWMGASGALHADALSYLRIILSGLLFMEMLPTMSGVMRAAGHPEYTLRINAVFVVVMTILEAALVLGWGPFAAMGVRAAGWASVIASATAVAVQMTILVRGGAGVKLHWHDMRPDRRTMWRVLRIALPSTLQRFSPNMANAVMLRIVGGLGPTVLTGYSVVQTIFGTLQAPSMGVSSAVTAMVGQNLGAKAPDRSERSARVGLLLGAGAAVVLMGTVNLVPARAIGLFDSRPDIVAAGIPLLRMMLVVSTTYAWTMVMNGALCGAGDTVTPMIISLVSMWLVQIPASWLLGHATGLGPIGVWIGLAVGYTVNAFVVQLQFRRGRWKTIRV